MITLGIDVGSITTKAVLISGGQVIGSGLAPSGYRPEESARNALAEALKGLVIDRDKIARVVATGYGRKSVSFADKAITEISCHAEGASFLIPSVRFVIDVGGQDSKAILLNGEGKVLNFIMNDKCAAGTGRFLEVMARALELSLDEMTVLSNLSTSPAKISSLCTVFAESEVISLIARGEARENIVAGIHEAIAQRIVAMARRLGIIGPVMITGGVAKNGGVVNALAKVLGEPVKTSPLGQFAGAIGAALLAGDSGKIGSG